MTHAIARLGMNLLLCSVAMPAMAIQPEQTAQAGALAAAPAEPNIIQHGEQGLKAENRFVLFTGEEINEFERRLKDPEQRVVLRAEQRAQMVSQNAGVGRVIGLDPATEQKLIELLTDQQMDRLDQMHVGPRSGFPDLQKDADETTQRMNALRDLLGDEKLDRFLDFQMNQSGRNWVGQFAARLAPADKLQPDQEDRLVALKQQQFQSSVAASGPSRGFRYSIGQPISIEDMQRDLQRRAVIANESLWRKRQTGNPALERQAAVFLTSTQLAELASCHAQEQDNLRRQVESARAAAGMDPKIPDQPEVVEEAPKLIEAQVRVEVSLTVNRESTTVTRTVRNGESFTFAAGAGLIAEATPTMYDDDWVDVHLKYYEDGVTGRRRLSGGNISSTHTRHSDGSLASGGSSGVVISGRRGYAVETSVKVKVL